MVEEKMTRDRVGKHFILAFLLAAVLYFGAFRAIEHRRQAKGPWRVTFATDAAGKPRVAVSHEMMKLTNVTLVFLGEQLSATNAVDVILFDAPKTTVPFGKVLFLDTTFLPGTVAFDFFGHEIEFIPRGLFVNRKEVSWQSGLTVHLSEKEKILKR